MIDTPSPRVLLATADLGGNVQPALGIAAKLRTDGASVHVLGHPAQRAAVSALQLPFTGYTRARPYDPLQRRSGLAGLGSLIGLVCDRSLGVDLLAVAAQQSSDIVLGDCMLLGGLQASSRAGIPTVALVHSLPNFFTGQWAHGPIGAAATVRGLRPGKVWSRLTGAVTVCLPELVGAPTALGGPVVGPVWPSTARPAPSPSGRPRLLVSLSTVWWPRMDTAAQRLLNALGTLAVDVVFTTGPALHPHRLAAPGNVELHQWLDHDLLMPEVHLVIAHGGHTTTMRALAHDLPLLMMPLHPMVDQPLVARTVTEHGAGLTLPRTASTPDITSAVQRLLNEPQFRTAAAHLGQQIRARDGAAAASAYLRQLASAPNRAA